MGFQQRGIHYLGIIKESLMCTRKNRIMKFGAMDVVCRKNERERGYKEGEGSI